MKIIESKNAPEPVGLYPHARKVGNLLFLSGVGPRKKNNKEIPGVRLNTNGKIVSYDISKVLNPFLKRGKIGQAEHIYVLLRTI